MRLPTSTCLGLALACLSAALASGAETSAEAYAAMGVKPAHVLTGTVLTTQVLPGAAKQVVSMTTYLTGKREKNDAVNVRLDVFERGQDKLVPLFSRDYGAEHGGGIAGGNLELVDLDMDGINEIIASFDSYEDPLIEQRLAEVIVYEPAGFRTAWSGLVKYDATKDARNVPAERRDRFEREVDVASTMRTKGQTLFLSKQVIAVAGDRLPQPKIVQETFPLRSERAR